MLPSVTNSAEKSRPGLLVAIEGLDGAGKSSLLQALAPLLVATKRKFCLTREPGGTVVGQALRQILQKQTIAVCPKAEFLLFAADRAEHFQTIVQPQLTQNKIVISDRMADSSLVYQGYGRGLDLNLIRTVNSWAMNNLRPDLVLYLDLPLALVLSRIAARAQELSAFEREHSKFLQQVAAGFTALFKNRTDVIKLDATLTVAALAQQAVTAILTTWKHKFGK